MRQWSAAALDSICLNARAGTFALGLIFAVLINSQAANAATSAPGVAGDLPAAITYKFEFTGWDGPSIDVFLYKPEVAEEDLQALFIMHGNRRNAESYLNSWIEQADEYGFVLVAPEFPRSKFDGSRTYNQGNVYRERGRNNYGRIKEKNWTFSAIEPLFDEVKQRVDIDVETYSIFGHSAGAQFVHRFVYFKPDARYETAIAANAGWYTLPSVVAKWPYGLGDTFLDAEDVKVALGKNLIVLLGTADTDTTSSSLRKTDEANAQGPHRLARGKSFFDVGRKTAKIYDAPFGWRIYAAPEVAHSNRDIAPFAAALLTTGAQ